MIFNWLWDLTYCYIALFQYKLGINMKKIFLLCLLLVTTNIFAQSTAVTLAVTNKVTAKFKKTERNISRGTGLSTGEDVRTAQSSLASLKYSNGTFVELGERSNYEILSYQPKQSDITIKAELSSGKLHSKTSGKLKEVLKTPVVALSILGTDYNVFVASPTKVYVRVNQGRVQARDKIFTAGQSFVVTPNSISKAPFPKEGEVNYMVTPPTSITNGQGPNAPKVAMNAPVCNGTDCDQCKVEVKTNEIIDVVDTSLFLSAVQNSMTAVLASIA